PVQPPTPPPNNLPTESPTRTTRIIAPIEVLAGESVYVELTTDNPDHDKILASSKVNWDWTPNIPSLRFQKLQDSRNWQVTFPEVSVRTIYTISFLAVNVELNMRFTGSTQIVVNPKPIVNPPKVTIYYPWENMPETRVVGPGVKLQIVGQIRQGTNTVVKLEILVDDRVVLTIPNPDYEFRFDLEEFGVPGTKPLIIRAIDSSGVAGESSVEIINDPAELERLARDFLLKYACTWDGQVVRFGDREDGPFAKPVRVYLWPEVIPYHSIVEEACEFWTRYTGIQFQVIEVPTLPTQIPLPCIVILGELNKSTTAAAITKKLYDSAVALKVVEGDITLYQGWLTLTDELKSLVIAHELGHVLLPAPNGGVDGKGHTADGHLMDRNGGNGLLAPYHQLAFKILYSHSPGDPL
ncbi:MAG: hypothetical protein QXP36_15105, partial [Conexivisphaerales archaeon]